jgi:hypothetical protein
MQQGGGGGGGGGGSGIFGSDGAGAATLPGCVFCGGTSVSAASHAALLLIGAICVQHDMPAGSLRLSKYIGSFVGQLCKRAPTCLGCGATGCMQCVGEDGSCGAPGARDHPLCNRCGTVAHCRIDGENEVLMLCSMCCGPKR